MSKDSVEFSRICQRVMEEQGYLIISSRPGVDPLPIGIVIPVGIVRYSFTGEYIDTNLRVVGIATLDEWKEQCRKYSPNELVWHERYPQFNESSHVKVIAE